MTRLIIVPVVLLLHFCSPFGALNDTAPYGSITVQQGITYAAGDRHVLDVYAPEESAAPAPVIVFFYGGGWETGERGMYHFLGASLAAHGVVVAIPDYRLHPAVQFPAFMQDGAAAVAWVRANIARFGGDPRRLFLMGHSAGAQIATLLALDPQYLHAVGLTPQRDLCGVIGIAGLYDFLPNASAGVNAVFGPEANWPRAQPINYVTPGAPPMLLLAGENDRTVDPGNTLQLAERLRYAGDTVKAEIEPGISHRAIIVAYSGLLSFLAPVRARTLAFMSACNAEFRTSSADRSR